MLPSMQPVFASLKGVPEMKKITMDDYATQ